MSDIYDCEFYLRCQNNSKCIMCGPTQRLLKLPQEQQRVKNQSRNKTGYNQKAQLNSDDSWKHLEQSVANDLNAIPTYREARRQVRSGGLWFLPGDVDDDDIRIECKERDMEARGKKTFSIMKDVLDKIIEEAQMDNKFPGMVFRYKGHEERYGVLPWEELLSLIHQFKAHYMEVQTLEKERDFWKAKAQALEASMKGGEKE